MDDEMVYKRVAIKALEDAKQEGTLPTTAFHNTVLQEAEFIIKNLDPVETSSEVRINLNEYVKVKLTDYGKEIYYHQFDDLHNMLSKKLGYRTEVFKPQFPKVDKQGYTTFQLYRFMNLYGKYLEVGKPNVIARPNEIIYIGECGYEE